MQSIDSVVQQGPVLFKRPDGRLGVRRNGESGAVEEIAVQATCAFPWSRPLEYISIRDEKGKELLMVEHLDECEPQLRELLEHELAWRNFIPQITAVDTILEANELVRWTVQTSAGTRSVLIRRHDHPRTLADGSILIKDVSNDLYLIPDVAALDPKSRKRLWMYLD